MFLIQSVTKLPSDEILGFFFDFGKEATVRVLGSVKRNQSSFKRVIKDYYPSTAIPFMLKVEGGVGRDSDNSLKLYHVTVTVCFPDNTEYMKTDHLMDMIVERQLLGGSQIPDFTPPSTFASKGFKGLVEEVLRKNNVQDTKQHKEIPKVSEGQTNS